MPGLLRARRRLRPRQRADPGAARRRRVGHRRAEGVDVAAPTSRLDLRRRPHRARLRSGTTACRSCWCRSTSTASRSGRSSSSPAARSSTRSSSPAPAPPPTWSSASPATAGGSRWRCSASSGASPRSASRSASTASSTAWSRWPATTARSTTRSCATGWRRPKVELEVMRLNALRTLSSGRRRRIVGRRRRSSIAKLVWASWHRRLGELAMEVAGPDGARRPSAPYELDRLAAALPLLPRRHDLRRQRRDPAQHPRRARARPARRSPRG